MTTPRSLYPHRLLVAEDNPEVADLIGGLLQAEDWEISVAASVAEARCFLDKQEYDCLLSDIYLGGDSGLDLLQFVRTEFPELTVILMTGQPTTELAIDGLTSGAHHFLIKPFSGELLRATLTRAVTHHHVQQENVRLRGQLQFLRATSSMELSGDIDSYVRQVLVSLQAETDADAVGYLERDPDFGGVIRRHQLGNDRDAILAVMDESLLQRPEILRGTRPIIFSGPAGSVPRTLICKPLVYQTTLYGVITALVPRAPERVRQGMLDIFSVLAGAVAPTIANQHLYQDIRLSYMQAIKALANAIEARDAYTAGHTDRVTRLAERLARRLGWAERRLENLVVGCTLHDIGKIGVPDAVLNKRGKLTDDERLVMQRHPLIGLKIITHVDLLSAAAPYVIAHHERYDGGGYPYGLAGEQIPVEGRVLAVVDTFDAILSDRPYRSGAGINVAIRELLSARGSQFDPAIVDQFVGVLNEQDIDLDTLYGRPLDLQATLSELLNGTAPA